jgi:hypothetical protein
MPPTQPTQKKSFNNMSVGQATDYINKLKQQTIPVTPEQPTTPLQPSTPQTVLSPNTALEDVKDKTNKLNKIKNEPKAKPKETDAVSVA